MNYPVAAAKPVTSLIASPNSARSHALRSHPGQSTRLLEITALILGHGAWNVDARRGSSDSRGQPHPGLKERYVSRDQRRGELCPMAIALELDNNRANEGNQK